MTERLPDVLTADEWRAFIGQFNEKAPTGLRNKALFTVMHDAGLRTCEVIGLKTSDVKRDVLDGRPVTVLEVRATKGRGEGKGTARVVFLSDEADRLLRAWIEAKRARGLGRSKRVFTTLKGGALDSGYIRTVCARKGKEAGIGWRVHPHALRHTAATNLLEGTGDLALVQDMLGHRNPTNTRVYAKVRNARLAAAMTGRDREPEVAPEVLALAKQIATMPEEARRALAAVIGGGAGSVRSSPSDAREAPA